MWTATLIRASRNHGRFDFEIEYLDHADGEITLLSYSLRSPTKKQVRNIARNEVSRLAALKSEILDLPVGQSINIDPDIIIPPPPPTAAEVARKSWFNDYSRLNSMLRITQAVPALLTAQAQTAIGTLRTSLEAGWLNSYLDGV